MEHLTSVLHKLKVFGPRRQNGFVELFISKRLLQGLATAMMGIFLPIFLYEVSGEQFWFVATFFALSSLGYIAFLVPGMKLTNYIGFSRALAFGALCSAAQFVMLYYTNTSNFMSLIIPFTIAVIGFKVFHWVPYHVDFTAFTRGGERGRDVGLVLASVAFMGMLGPALAGFIIAKTGYHVLFVICILLFLAAAISYLFVPVVEERFTWSFKETIHNLFATRYRNVLISEVAYGAEAVVTLVAWPIFLYEVLGGDVLEIGLLTTAIVFITIMLQLLVGRYLDVKGTSKAVTLKRGSFFDAVGWILKIFVFSATQIFFISLYHNITKIFTQTPYDAILYDLSGDQGHYVDEFTVLREIALHVGRVLALAAMIILTLYVSLEWTFIIGALAALFLNAVYRVRA